MKQQTEQTMRMEMQFFYLTVLYYSFLVQSLENFHLSTAI